MTLGENFLLLLLDIDHRVQWKYIMYNQLNHFMFVQIMRWYRSLLFMHLADFETWNFGSTWSLGMALTLFSRISLGAVGSNIHNCEFVTATLRQASGRSFKVAYQVEQIIRNYGVGKVALVCLYKRESNLHLRPRKEIPSIYGWSLSKDIFNSSNDRVQTAVFILRSLKCMGIAIQTGVRKGCLASTFCAVGHFNFCYIFMI